MNQHYRMKNIWREKPLWNITCHIQFLECLLSSTWPKMQLTMKDGFPPSHKVFCVAWKLNVPADPQEKRMKRSTPKGKKITSAYIMCKAKKKIKISWVQCRDREDIHSSTFLYFYTSINMIFNTIINFMLFFFLKNNSIPCKISCNSWTIWILEKKCHNIDYNLLTFI